MPEDFSDYVVGRINLPWHRMIMVRLALPLMRLGVPGAAWVYFRAAFGPGVNFSVHRVDL